MNCVVCFSSPCNCRYGKKVKEFTPDHVGRKELDTLRWIVKEIDYGVNVGSDHMEKYFRDLSNIVHEKIHKLGNEIQVRECEQYVELELSKEENTQNIGL